MIKKAIFGGLLLMGASTFVFGNAAWTYMKTAGSEIRQSVKSQVPIEFEVRRAQQLVEDLVPEIRQAMHVIAEQQVEVETLHRAVNSRQDQLTKQKDAILALRENLDTGDTQYVIAGRSYSQQQVEKDLATRFRRFKMAEETLTREQEILTARQSSLASNEEHLATLISTKKDLEAQLAQLDARMRSVKAAESISESTLLDDSRLQKAKGLIAELNKQLDIKERLLETETDSAGLIPVESDLEPEVDITTEIDTYFEDDLADRKL
ncbi:hypothetical protein [Rubinisphaera margarita]|uniref:hypothetical protein n=1 Tax=Rubinisphaera margarita TaxID=2909586 RepID=UPI001EE8047F|nr:hypothetical protein [Rubinisphaera margarita]MCG6157822.1 hypothetical protein [Rubinisphaera margarita]